MFSEYIFKNSLNSLSSLGFSRILLSETKTVSQDIRTSKDWSYSFYLSAKSLQTEVALTYSIESG